MFIIGITGTTGAGKTSAMRALKRLGALTLDCDEIYHKLLLSSDEMKAELETRFKGVVVNGIVDREKLGSIVFSDPDALSDLNTITHIYIINEVDRRIALYKAKGGLVAAIDAIALIESGQCKKCDIVIGVIAPEEIRISRIMNRDGLTKEQAQMRINAQQPDKFYTDKCDHILEGVYDRSDEFEEKCKDFFTTILAQIPLDSDL